MNIWSKVYSSTLEGVKKSNVNLVCYWGWTIIAALQWCFWLCFDLLMTSGPFSYTLDHFVESLSWQDHGTISKNFVSLSFSFLSLSLQSLRDSLSASLIIFDGHFSRSFLEIFIIQLLPIWLPIHLQLSVHHLLLSKIHFHAVKYDCQLGLIIILVTICVV